MVADVDVAVEVEEDIVAVEEDILVTDVVTMVVITIGHGIGDGAGTIGTGDGVIVAIATPAASVVETIIGNPVMTATTEIACMEDIKV